MQNKRCNFRTVFHLPQAHNGCLDMQNCYRIKPLVSSTAAVPGSQKLFEHIGAKTKWIFFNENVWISMKISLKFVPALVQIMAWHWSGDKQFSEILNEWLYGLLTLILGLNELKGDCLPAGIFTSNFHQSLVVWVTDHLLPWYRLKKKSQKKKAEIFSDSFSVICDLS